MKFFFKKIHLMMTGLHSPVEPCLICIGCSMHISLQTASGNPSHNMECHLYNNGTSLKYTAGQTFMSFTCHPISSFHTSTHHLPPAQNQFLLSIINLWYWDTSAARWILTSPCIPHAEPSRTYGTWSTKCATAFLKQSVLVLPSALPDIQHTL
jgi:hypothetical protein